MEDKLSHVECTNVITYQVPTTTHFLVKYKFNGLANMCALCAQTHVNKLKNGNFILKKNNILILKKLNT
jgi:hypothetical protein